jgi:hypothetical protein
MTDSPTPPSAVGPPATSAAAANRWNWRPGLRWFGAEFLVVVTGVLVALALSAWWEGQQQVREEQRLLVALLDEFTANQGRLGEILDFHTDVKGTARTLLAVSVAPNDTVTADYVDQLLADVSWWSSYTTLESTVLDAAVQDGQLGLIRTDSLRRLLGTWRSEVASAAAQSSQEFAHHSGTWLPLLQAEADIAQLNNSSAVVPGGGQPYQGTPIPLGPERTDHRPLIRTRALRNALVQKLWIEDDVLYQYERLRPLLLRILTALEQEIPGRAGR